MLTNGGAREASGLLTGTRDARWKALKKKTGTTPTLFTHQRFGRRRRRSQARTSSPPATTTRRTGPTSSSAIPQRTALGPRKDAAPEPPPELAGRHWQRPSPCARKDPANPAVSKSPPLFGRSSRRTDHPGHRSAPERTQRRGVRRDPRGLTPRRRQRPPCVRGVSPQVSAHWCADVRQRGEIDESDARMCRSASRCDRCCVRLTNRLLEYH